MAADPVAVEAARLLGHQRPWRRATDPDLLAEGQYHVREARAALANGDAELAAYHRGELDWIGAEVTHRLKHGRVRRGGGLTADAIEAIKRAVPCQEYLGYLGITNLKPAGRERWVGLCPFHAERTPSLSVHAAYFKCFGCGVGGDVFALAQAVIGLSRSEPTFRDAVRVLADYAGLPDPTVPPRPAGWDAQI